MAKATYVIKTIWIAVLISLAIASVLTASALAQTDWREIAPGNPNIPARARAILWPQVRMDAQNCVTQGRWSVCFGNQLPILYMQRFGNGEVLPRLAISPLRCKNPVIGELECFLDLWPSWAPTHRNYPEACSIWEKKPGGPFEGRLVGGPLDGFGISCPSRLVLE